MIRARNYAKTQYNSVVNYMKSLEVNKPIHIGETGWASYSNFHYGDEGSKATDEYKEGLYYQLLREWTNNAGISCFFFTLRLLMNSGKMLKPLRIRKSFWIVY
jgi:hypothetical protein